MKILLFLVLTISISQFSFSQDSKNQSFYGLDEEKEDSLLEIEEEKHNGHFQGVDFGLTTLLNNSFKASFPNDPQWKNDVLTSFNFNFNFYDRKIVLKEDKLGITLGIGLNLTKIAFSDNWTLKDAWNKKDSATYGKAQLDTIKFSRNKLNLAYIQIPFLLEYTPKKNFWLSGGVIVGYKIIANVKQVYTDSKDPNIEYQRTINGSFALNTFKCDATIRTGFGQYFGRMYGAFITYALVPMFDTSLMANVHPLTFGISYNW